MEEVLRIEEVSKSFSGKEALCSVTFAVRGGEMLSLLGPNGAGKTTTMKAITTYLNPTAGEIFIGDFSVHEHPKRSKSVSAICPKAIRSTRKCLVSII